MSQSISPKLSYRSANLQPLARLLKAAAAFPVYLPSARDIPRKSAFLDIVEHNNNKYYIELETTPHCMGGATCSVGAIVGHKTMDPTVPMLSGKRIELADGRLGFWVKHQCAYLGCVYNGITFERDGDYYEAALVNGSLKETLDLARSMSRI